MSSTVMQNICVMPFRMRLSLDLPVHPYLLLTRIPEQFFGDYIDIYDMTRAVEDGTTVRIFYESRIAKLELPDELKPVIDDEYEESPNIRNIPRKKSLRPNGQDLKPSLAPSNGLKPLPRHRGAL